MDEAIFFCSIQNTQIVIIMMISQLFSYFFLYKQVYYQLKMENTLQQTSSSILQRRQTGQSLDEYKPRKILPHINQQYQFRITNRLLIQKIINPRRDRTIIDSLATTTFSNIYKKKQGGAHHQPLINYRRKVIATSSKKYKPPLSKNSSEKSLIFNNQSKSNRCSQKQLDCHRESEEKNINQDQNQIQLKDAVTESKLIETQSVSLRNNFVGKIIRNCSGRNKQLSKRKINLSNICDNFSFSSSLFTDNQIEERQSKWKESKPMKKRRQIRSNKYHSNELDKQNNKELENEQFE